MLGNLTLKEIKTLADDIQLQDPHRYWVVDYHYQERSHLKVGREIFATRKSAVTFIACIRSSCETVRLVRR